MFTSCLLRLEDLFGKELRKSVAYLLSALTWMIGLVGSGSFWKVTWLLVLNVSVGGWLLSSFPEQLMLRVFWSKSFVWLMSLNILFISMKVLSILSNDSFGRSSTLVYKTKSWNILKLPISCIHISKHIKFTFWKMFLFISSTSCFKDSVVA